MTLKRSRCPHCKRKLDMAVPNLGIHDECVQPWAEAFQAKQERARAKQAREAKKAERETTKRRKAELKTIPELIKEAQTAFNAYIRERDKAKGCFVCGRAFEPIPGRVQHAGHVRSRGAAGHLRFNEDNCHGECEGCNGPYGAKPHEIKAGAIERIGQARFDALEADNTPHKWTRDELIAIKEKYRAKLRELKAQA